VRALVFRGPNDLAVQDIVEPRARPGHVVLEVDYAGICGSDVHGYTGETGRRAPGATMGHEFCGRVVAVGDGVPSTLVGLSATANPLVGCGRCEACEAGCSNRCASFRVVGVDAALPGAFSERVTVPAASLVLLSDSTGPRGVLAEPLAVGIHAVGCAGDVSGRDVLVLGCGMIGLACAWSALDRGARAVFAADVDPQRVRSAVELGARAAEGATDADVVVDAVGITATMTRALGAVRRGGVVVLVGMGSPVVQLDTFALVVGERRLVGSYCYGADDFRYAASVIDADASFNGFLDDAVGLDEAPEVFAALAAGRRSAIKSIVAPRLRTPKLKE
jgi:2-desacetyl-2-hydroxyethyl bacteriochlorophyllide A dehydrogenase